MDREGECLCLSAAVPTGAKAVFMRRPGYDFEKDILGKMMKTSAVTRELIPLFDVMVDGKFVAEKKNLSLKFRGSENQRVLNVKKSLEEGRGVWREEFR